MYTSCGWFFDELSGLETVQVMQYAARAIQLGTMLFGNHREEHFMELLAYAPTNIPDYLNGAEIYRRFVKPAMVDLLGVGAHYAISALFRNFEQHSAIYSYEVNLLDSRKLQSGRMQLAVGRANICSRITRNQSDVTFGVLHLGDNNVIAGVREFRGGPDYNLLLRDTEAAFARVDIADMICALDRHFDQTAYSLKSLFKDERRRVVGRLLESVVDEAEAMYRQIYDSHASLMRFLGEIHMPYPRVLSVTAEFVVNSALRRSFEDDPLDIMKITALLDTARRENLSLDVPGLSYALTGRINSLMQAFAAMPADTETLERMNTIFSLIQSLPFRLNLWKVQNLYYGLSQSLYPEMAERKDQRSREWVRLFSDLGQKLGITLRMASTEEPKVVAA